jgi:hypothetical protein
MFKSEQMDSSRLKSMSDISVFCLGNINSHASMYLTHISYTGFYKLCISIKKLKLGIFRSISFHFGFISQWSYNSKQMIIYVL